METNQTYSFDEAFQTALAYFGGDELAARVWVNKYAMKDSLGNIYEKSPEQMHWRIADEIARIEHKYKNPLAAHPGIVAARGPAGLFVAVPSCASTRSKCS